MAHIVPYAMQGLLLMVTRRVRSSALRRLAFLIVGITFVPAGADDTPIPITTALVATGLSQPLFVTSPPGDRERLFVVEQVEARIRIVRQGVLLDMPFLDIDDRVSDLGGERGLLGLAFHPDYAVNGQFFVNYTLPGIPGDTQISRFIVGADPDLAVPESEVKVLRIDQPFSNHNGGMLAFGPRDHLLYIASGDGGSGNDPLNKGQSLDTLLGKILRLDVNAATYAIPPSNPFVGRNGARAEIWAYGLRNPWRMSFDRLTGDLYVADVGQNAREEVNVQPATSPGGENYGWRVAEGFACRGGGGECGTNQGFTPPVLDYGRSDGGSVTGGYVYRGVAIPDLRGTYFFGDFVSDRVWSFRYVSPGIEGFQERTAEVAPTSGPAIESIASFGEDARGELYIVSLKGQVFKIVPRFNAYDIDVDARVSATDLQLVVNAILQTSHEVGDTDLNNDGKTDSVDLQLMVNAILDPPV